MFSFCEFCDDSNICNDGEEISEINQNSSKEKCEGYAKNDHVEYKSNSFENENFCSKNSLNFPNETSSKTPKAINRQNVLLDSESKKKSKKNSAKTSKKNKNKERPVLSSQNSRIIKFRKKIEDMSSNCFQLILEEMEEIKCLLREGKLLTDIYKNRNANLCLQQKEFDSFINNLKDQYSTNNCPEDDILALKLIFKSMKKETEIFKQFFPAYGLKSEILSEIEKNQVIIISADHAYFFNIVLPLVLYDNFLNHSIISCESTRILCQVLQRRIDSFFQDDRSNDRVFRVLPEEHFMTLSADPTYLTTPSCIIYNMPLKRSVFSDILLANIKDLLMSQENSKLILLLSPYENVSKFKDFFRNKMKCRDITMPKLSYPVTTIWKQTFSTLDDDFIQDVVKTVMSIHAISEMGDIVVFLPSSSDVQAVLGLLNKKMHSYQYDDLVVYSSDGSKVKTALPREEANQSIVRKAFLVTNADDGLIIPSVKYVVDCGIQKECFYDPKTDTNNFAPSFISKARAKIRKETAGISKVGKCYRLYNKDNYKLMKPNEYPEIFCINPMFSLLKVFKYCPYQSENIQFVHSLPSDVLDSTLALLSDYGAVDGGLLTTFGEKLMELPFKTKYSRFIILASQWGVTYEAIVLAAYFSAETDVFVESENDVQQKLIDSKRLDFNVQDSDTLTFLNIFKMWKENGCKMAWCNDNYINHATLKNIRSEVNRMFQLTNDCLSENITEDFSGTDDYNELLQVLCASFGDCLCVFTGHHRVGYQVLASHELALVHPSSLVFPKQDYPTFVIYNEMIEGSQNFIANLTCVPLELIEFLRGNVIKFSQSELFGDKLIKKVIEPIGDKVISQVLLKNNGQKVRELEERIKQKLGAKVLLIEPILGKGCVDVYAFPSDIAKCFTDLKEILLNRAQALTNEEDLRIKELVKGSNKVIVQLKWVKGASIVSFEHIVDYTQSPIALSFSNEDSSEESVNSSSIKFSLKLFWPRRICVGKGFLNFKNRNSFEKGRRLSFNSIPVGEKEVYVRVSQDQPYQLVITGIDKDLTKEQIADSFSDKLPNCEFDVEILYSPPFDTTDQDLHRIKEQLEENCRRMTNMQQFQVRVLKPDPSSYYMKAEVKDIEERDLDNEAINLSYTKIDYMKIECEPFYFSCIRCSTVIYNALKYRFQDERQRIEFEQLPNHHGKWFEIETPLRNVATEELTIELSSNSIHLMKCILIMVNKLLDGMKLDKNNLPDIQKMFCHGGHIFLKNLQKTENVYVLENFETQTIRLYGLLESCNRVKQFIYDFLEDSENQIPQIFNLSNQDNNRIVMKQIIHQFGVNLEPFIELFGLRSAALDIRNCSITLIGEREKIQQAEECLREISTNVNATYVCSSTSTDEICVVCTVTAVKLMSRLEVCGHIYCSICLRNLVEQANLPLQCAAEDCSVDIILSDIKNALNDDEQQINELVDKALKDYLDKNKVDIFFCPAPDCSFFTYKKEITEQKWNCPLCKNSICVSCHVVFHEGVPCDMYQGSKLDADYPFKVYKENNPECKHCPSCNSAVEKMSGCNRVTCMVCKCHFCWLCLDKYTTRDAAYNHIDQKHPGLLWS